MLLLLEIIQLIRDDTLQFSREDAVCLALEYWAADHAYMGTLAAVG